MAHFARLVGGLRPSRRCNTVLLLTRGTDVAADRVARRVMARGIPVRRFDGETLLDSTRIELRLDGDDPDGTLMLSTGPVPVRDISSVWCRFFLGEYATRQVGVPTPGQQFAREECAQVLHGLVGFLGHALWVNRPEAAYGATKLAQLRVPRKIGWRVPRTLVTNDMELARAFVASCRPAAIVKPFNWLFEPRKGLDQTIYAHRLRREEAGELHRVSLAPCLLQEEVERAAELRVTVAGRHVLAAELRSGAGPGGPVDWRSPKAETTLRAVDLAPILAEACRVMTAAFGLHFATVDVIVRPDGEPVFLEMNSHGNWAHVEDATDLRSERRSRTFSLHGRAAVMETGEA